MYLYIYINSSKDMEHYKFWPSWLGLQNTLTTSLQRGKTTSRSILDIGY